MDWIQLDTSTVRVSEVWMDMGARFKIWHVSEHHAPHLGNYVQYVAANCEGFRSWIDHDSKYCATNHDILITSETKSEHI